MHASVRGATERAGIFSYMPTGEQQLLDIAPLPAGFGTGARYRRFDDFALAPGGGRIALLARVKDTVRPRQKAAVFRCVETEAP